MTVAELSGRISSAELSEWQAADRLDHEDRQLASLATEANGKLDARVRRRGR